MIWVSTPSTVRASALSMSSFPNLVICEHCDTVHRRRVPAAGEQARCERCAAVLYGSGCLDIDQWLALTIGAAIVFVLANVCPVVGISLKGLYSEATLWQAAAALAHGTIGLIAIPTALSIILIPFLQIALLVWLLSFARVRRRAPGFAPTMRLLVLLRPWSMVEVAVLGILVAIVKLTSFVQVAPGVGIWANAVLMVLIPLIASRDVHSLWDLTAPPAIGGVVA